MPHLDGITTGFYDGDLIIIGARPSMGKTAFGINIANNICNKGGKVYFASLEMTKVQLLTRILSIRSAIKINDLKNREFYEQNKDKIQEHIKSMEGMNLLIDDKRSRITSLVAHCRKIKDDVDIFIFDYLQIIKHNDKSRTREQEVSYISGELKNLAKETGKPVIALSQLSRPLKGVKPQPPQLSDLRESGSIEQDADTVIFIHRPDYYTEESNKEIQDAKILVEKGRNSGTGACIMKYHPYNTYFQDDQFDL